MTIKQVLHLYQAELAGKYEEREAQNLAYLTLEQVLQQTKTQLWLNNYQILLPKQKDKLKQILQELSTYKPIQYILGTADFYGLTLSVNKNVLIPRPETEELVDWMVQTVRSNKMLMNRELHILDIGTGSGCIALALKHALGEKINMYALDISKKALDVARKNAINLNLDIRFIEQDISKMQNYNTFLHPTYDIIVSNPPYILEEEKELLKENVVNYEPHLALFTQNNDATFFYKHIANFAKKHLRPTGQLFFELHERMAHKVENCLTTVGFPNLIFRKDLSDRFRMLKASKQ